MFPDNIAWVGSMAKQDGNGLGALLFGAFALWYIFGGDDKATTTNVTSNISTPAIEQVTPQTTTPSSPTITIRKPTKPSTKKQTTSLQKPVTQQALPVVNYQAKKMYVDASRLNVRNAPTKQGKVIWTLKRDQQVQVTNKDGDWLYIEHSRFNGWVFGTYLTKTPTPKKASVPKKQKKQTTGLSTSRIKKILIKRSHAYYPGNCPCPYNITAAGRKCGGRSAWSRPGGREPLCYASDVTAGMVADYRARQ